MGATPIDSIDIAEVLMRKESLIPDRMACGIQAHAVPSVWEMNLNCWMLPLATYCHIHYHFTHSTLCCSSSNSWLLNKIQQKYSGTFTGVQKPVIDNVFLLGCIMEESPEEESPEWSMDVDITGVLIRKDQE